MTTPVTYSAHPFDNNTNPATAEGTKLWKTGTAERTNKIALNELNAKLIIAYLKKDSNQFCWGAQVNSIQNSPEANTDRKSVILNVALISTEDIQKQAMKTWMDRL